MKKIILILAAMAVFSNVHAFEEELGARYKNKPSEGIYKIWIEPVRDANNIPYALYDSLFNPLPFTHQAYIGIEADEIRFNAVYYNAGSMGSNNGSVYYGKYLIEFRDYTNPTPTNPYKRLDIAYIDFRDCDYGYPAGELDSYYGVANSQDFFVNYNFYNPPSGDTSLAKKIPTGLYFEYGDSILTGTSYGIWELFSYASRTTKLQNVSLFKNFTLDINTTESIQPVSVNINSTIYPMDQNSYLQLAYGFNGTNVSLSVPNKAYYIPGWHCFFPFLYFSAWSDGVAYETVRNFYIKDQAISLQAIYKGSSQRLSISGPDYFVPGQTVAFTASPSHSRTPDQIEYTWYIQYDNQSEQYIGNQATVNVATPTGITYGFNIKCIARG